MPRLNTDVKISASDKQKISRYFDQFERGTPTQIGNNPKDLLYAAKLIEHYYALQEKGGHLCKLFQPNSPLSIEHYPHHKAFFDATRTNKEVLFRAANRVGKTESGAYAVTCWSTGIYPDWWEGRVFDKQTYGWACGDTNDTVRTILQAKLLGSPIGTGLIPAKNIIDTVVKPNTGGTVDTIFVRHEPTGKVSQIKFKCHPYDSRILMADGSWSNIGDVSVGDAIRSPDGTPRQVTQRFQYDNAPVLRISTPSGSIKCTPNHPIYTQNRGWVNAGDIVLGDVLETCFFEPDSYVEKEDWEITSTALMIGDGCTRGKTPTFTCNEPEIVDLVVGILPDDLRVKRIKGTISYKISALRSGGGSNRLTLNLRRDDLWNVLSKDKHLPDWVFRLTRDKRVLFLRWLWGCDGTISPKHATYCTASKRLANDVRLLLWSLGMETKVSKAYCAAYPDNTYYHVRLNGENRLKFSEIGKLNRSSIANLKPRERNDRTVVKEIKQLQPQSVYCVGVEDVHELIVEGFRVGNTYESKARSFFGKDCDWVWMDEEPTGSDAALIWNQAYTRLLTTKGNLIITFTPIAGWTPLVKTFSETAVDLTPKEGIYVGG